MNKSEETIAEETYKSLLMEVLETNSFEGLVSTRKKITDYTTSVKTLLYQKWVADHVLKLETTWKLQFKSWKQRQRG